MIRKPKNIKDTDESVSRMVKEWDVVRCSRCGKKISMMNSYTVRGGDLFVCKSCYKNG